MVACVDNDGICSQNSHYVWSLVRIMTEFMMRTVMNMRCKLSLSRIVGAPPLNFLMHSNSGLCVFCQILVVTSQCRCRFDGWNVHYETFRINYMCYHLTLFKLQAECSRDG